VNKKRHRPKKRPFAGNQPPSTRDNGASPEFKLRKNFILTTTNWFVIIVLTDGEGVLV
jgi:hypothetical protein